MSMGLSASLLLFDMQGFFDHIQPAHLVYLLHLFGYPPPLCGWVQAFLSDRTTSLWFNRFMGPSHAMNNSTLQGLPISPILSAIYTAPLLCLAERWLDCHAQFYVDDGTLMAIARDHEWSAHLVASHFHIVVNWMACCGLGINPDKTNLITFCNKCGSRCLGDPVTTLALRYPPHSDTHFTVRPAVTTCYLGVFLHQSLSWMPHASIMANWARSTICSLHLLGNSVCGLDYANWRKAYLGIVFPILSYGTTVWLNNHHPKVVMVKMAVTQNNAL
jgi:hypothetical protein